LKWSRDKRNQVMLFEKSVSEGEDKEGEDSE